MSNFISDFLEYNSGTECHKNFLRWSAISALGISAGLRYSLKQGRLRLTPNMYILLVGGQGTRKTYAKDQTRKLIEEAFPDHPIGADVTTRDDLIKYMSSEVTERAYVDATGASDVYHPMALLINEFKSFLSYNPIMMITFIVDIYDRTDKIYVCRTIKRGEESITHPCLNILSCENTEWLINNLKGGIITGGLSRRFIVVYEDARPERPIPLPYLPANSKALWDRMVLHLRNLHTTSKEYKWEPAGEALFRKWYVKNFHNLPDDPNMAGFMTTKDQQLLKTCIALDLAEEKPCYTITEELVSLGLAMFDAIEPNMPKLYASAGRNELALPQQKLIELIESRNGIMTEKEVMRLTGKDLGPMEQLSSIKFLVDTEQIWKQTFRWPDDKAGVKTWLVSKKGMEDPKLVQMIKQFNNQR